MLKSINHANSGYMASLLETLLLATVAFVIKHLKNAHVPITSSYKSSLFSTISISVLTLRCFFMWGEW